MFHRGLLALFFIVLIPLMLTLGHVVASHAATPADPREQIVPVPLTTFPTVVTVQHSANVRAGPGTEFAIISSARPGQRLSVLGCNIDCSWYLLAENCWIAAFLVKAEEPVAVVPVVATVEVAIPVLPPILPTALLSGSVPVPTVVVGVPITPPETTTRSARCPQAATGVTTYAGPGTFYPVVDTRLAGECLAIIGRNATGDWYQLFHDMWIEVSVLLYADPIEFFPVTDRIFTATPEPPPALLAPVTLTAEEQAYLDLMAQQTATYVSAWATLEGQLRLAEENVLLMQTSDWRGQTDAAIAVIRLTSESIRTRIPPPRLTPFHAQMLVAANYYDEAMVYVVEAITTLDTSRFAVARRCVQLANDAIARTVTVLEIILQGQGDTLVVPVATMVTATSVPLPTTVPNATPTMFSDLSEIMTVGEWLQSSQDRKVASARLWTQRLAEEDMVVGDVEAFAVQMYACVENTISDSSALYSESYSIYEIAGPCAALLNGEISG